MSSESKMTASKLDTHTTDNDDGFIKTHNPERWFFSKSRLENTPSVWAGIGVEQELTYRQQAASFIQDIGQRLKVNQLGINTAIVYMHRFYMYHSFTIFHRYTISVACFYLAAKVEEQQVTFEDVIKVSYYCLNRDQPIIDSQSEAYNKQTAELVINESILLQTLGFDLAVDHPHTHVVKCCELVQASRELRLTSYFMATNSLHLTTMCLQYRPTVVACMCIHLACKWSNWEIPRSKQGKDWWKYVDQTVTVKELEELTLKYLAIIDKSPTRLKSKIMSLKAASSGRPIPSTLGKPKPSGLDVVKSRPRSPSPKRVRVARLEEGHGSMMHSNSQQQLQATSLQDVKPFIEHQNQPLSQPASKHGHISVNPFFHSKSIQPPCAKNHQLKKESHHRPLYQQQQNSKKPLSHSGDSAPNAQTHRSHSSQGYKQQG